MPRTTRVLQDKQVKSFQVHFQGEITNRLPANYVVL